MAPRAVAVAPAPLASLGPRAPPALGARPGAGGLPSGASSSRTEARPVLHTTKEWIIPARPKPGRKPAQVEPDAGQSKKAVNRASQRAFRERRQEYVAELEDKVRALEQGEGEKAVFFQQQALRAKAETTQLRTENQNLRLIIDQLRHELASLGRPHGGQVADSPAAAAVGSSARRRPSADAAAEEEPSNKRPRRMSSRVALAGPRRIYRDSPPLFEEEAAIPAKAVPSCGYCDRVDGCFCESVGYKVDHATSARPGSSPAEHKVELSEPMIKIEEGAMDDAFAVAVPLKLRRAPSNAVKKAPVWAITSTATANVSPNKPALCNGDPANCPACQDDPFGKAFCNALSSSVCASQPCSSCPSHKQKRMPTPPPETNQAELDEAEAAMLSFVKELPCCGDPEMCGSLTCGPKGSTTSVEILPRSVPSGVRTVETVPCNEAWQTLKSHPHIAFANLSMLADVVARRTTCDGPVARGSDGAPQPRPVSPFAASVSPLGVVCAAEAGQRKRLTVERGAVDEALKLLDSAVATTQAPFSR